ncbi:MAG: DnaB-like helicase C-terminal domain-containing protein, partial [Mesotoga sp.]|uniref:DnaB-like helicase C-terminal domain-containing protein n=1 Tax=Mesotoga sp. TaxID=2053577 RepID=UPI00261867C8
VVILIYRPILYNKSQSLNEYHAIIGKQRNGKTGTIYMDFNMTRQFIEGAGTSAKCEEERSPSLV